MNQTALRESSIENTHNSEKNYVSRGVEAGMEGCLSIPTAKMQKNDFVPKLLLYQIHFVTLLILRCFIHGVTSCYTCFDNWLLCRYSSCLLHQLFGTVTTQIFFSSQALQFTLMARNVFSSSHCSLGRIALFKFIYQTVISFRTFILFVLYPMSLY